MCSRTAKPPPSRPDCASIPGWKWSAGITSAACAEAIRQAVPQAVQVSDRWHLWHNLAAAVEKTVVAHSTCSNTTPSPEGSALAARTRERFSAVHALLAEGTGLRECARRLGWAPNTVKRYARAERVQELLRPPRYGACLVDPTATWSGSAWPRRCR